MKLSELSRRRAQHLIVFGEPKTGKSTLVSELTAHGYTLHWISMDNGHGILWKLPPKQQELLDVVVIPDTKEFPVAVATCLKIVSGKKVSICGQHGQVDCSTCRRLGDSVGWSEIDVNSFGPMDIIVFDHIQQIAASAMNQILKKDKVEEDEKIEWKHWGIQGVLMDKFLTNVQQATYNVICITHVSETELEDGTKKLVPLVGSSVFSRNSGKFFDHMIYCQMINKDHRFGSSTGYQNRVVTGSRSDVEIEKEKIPSLVKFFNGSISQPERAGSKLVEKMLVEVPVSYDTSKGISTLIPQTPVALAPEVSIPTTVSPELLVTEVQAPDTNTLSRLELLARMRKGK
jgi:AAA domain